MSGYKLWFVYTTSQPGCRESIAHHAAAWYSWRRATSKPDVTAPTVVPSASVAAKGNHQCGRSVGSGSYRRTG